MNRPILQRTIFTNAKNKKEKSYGFRISDDHGQEFSDVLKAKDLKLSDQRFLNKCRECFGDVGNSIFDCALEHGMYIDDTWYTFDLNHKNGARLVLPARIALP